MQKHQMSLNGTSFRKVKNGTKTIELRLYDEKRQQMWPGDEIEFTSLDTGEKVQVKVLGLLRYPTFEALYKDLDLKAMGSTAPDDWKLMYQFYPPEKEKKYGVLGIRIQLI